FKAEIERLLKECEDLYAREQDFKEQLQALRNQRAVLLHQMNVAKHAHKELERDYEFSTDDLPEEHVECPTCGAIYENYFAERFAIAQDQDRVMELMLGLQTQTKETSDKIKSLEDKFLQNTEARVAIEAALEQRKETLALRDLVESQGRKQITMAFSTS